MTEEVVIGAPMHNGLKKLKIFCERKYWFTDLFRAVYNSFHSEIEHS